MHVCLADMQKFGGRFSFGNGDICFHCNIEDYLEFDVLDGAKMTFMEYHIKAEIVGI